MAKVQHDLHQNTLLGVLFIYGDNGIRKSGPTEGRVKKCPVDTFLARGRIQRSMAAVRRTVDRDLSSQERERDTLWVSLLFVDLGFESPDLA